MCLRRRANHGAMRPSSRALPPASATPRASPRVRRRCHRLRDRLRSRASLPSRASGSDATRPRTASNCDDVSQDPCRTGPIERVNAAGKKNVLSGSAQGCQAEASAPRGGLRDGGEERPPWLRRARCAAGVASVPSTRAAFFFFSRRPQQCVPLTWSLLLLPPSFHQLHSSFSIHAMPEHT